jgi:hypothetical protein
MIRPSLALGLFAILALPAAMVSAPARAEVFQRELEEITAEYQNRNLFNFRSSLSAKTIQARNEELVKALGAVTAEKEPGTRNPTLTMAQAEELYDWLDNHEVAAQTMLWKYDPKKNIGFCFGRAFTIHMELLAPKVKLQRSSVQKIWAVGPMHGGWGHHVATMGKADTGGFIVIDPVMGRPVTPQEWIARMQSQFEMSPSVNPVMFFVTKPERFGPASSAKYSQLDLFGPGRDRLKDIYHGYFMDVLDVRRKTFDEEQKAKAALEAAAASAATPEVPSAEEPRPEETILPAIVPGSEADAA